MQPDEKKALKPSEEIMNDEIELEARKLYRVSIENLRSVTNLDENSNVGFEIPEYQRSYEWSKEDIERLLYDALTGLVRLDKKTTDTNASDFTFLGSIILVRRTSNNPRPSGSTYDIVDGQQRLTTLALCACALSTRLRYYKSTLDSSVVQSSKHLNWIVDEFKNMITELDNCVLGSIDKGHGEFYRFPKIIQSGGPGRGDERGNSEDSSIYNSSIGKFFHKFSIYKKQESDKSYTDFVLPKFENPKSKATKKIIGNYKIVCDVVANLNDSIWYEDLDFEQLKMKSIHKPGYEKLFHKISQHFTEDELGGVLKDIGKVEKLEPMIRTLLFSSYFHSRILLSLIDTDNESVALDMFDSLNTTGQPLTALETLRSRVVSFERKSNSRSGFANSASDHSYTKIQSYIDEKYVQPLAKSRMTKELIISFALYVEGEKIRTELPDQRRFLTKAYYTASGKGLKTARLFVSQIAKLSEFRYHYFDRANSDKSKLSQFHSSSCRSEVELLSSFIASMNTSLAIPTLFRYWTFTDSDTKHTDEARFLEVLRAVTAFIVLRRAATGGTDGIDNDLRGLMSPKKIPKTTIEMGNCTGSAFDREILKTTKLKAALIQLLKSKLGKLDKANWIKKVIENPIYNHSQPLARFMILVAAHRSKPSPKNDGTWMKTGVRPGSANKFYSVSVWKGEECSSVEHIAPNRINTPKVGWDKELYSSEVIRHRLGNLTLLPKIENSSTGNQSWVKKKLFYKAAASEDISEQKRHLAEAAKDGVRLPPATVELLETTHNLQILRPLTDLDEYNRKTVETRSRNIADLCWKFFRPWLN